MGPRCRRDRCDVRFRTERRASVKPTDCGDAAHLLSSHDRQLAGQLDHAQRVASACRVRRVASSGRAVRPRRRQAGYVSKGVPYPTRVDPEPGTTHQIDMVGPHHLDGAVEFHALNLIDVSSHSVGSQIPARPPRPGPGRSRHRRNLDHDRRASRRPVRQPLQLQRRDPSRLAALRTVVATCVDLDVVVRLIPRREPWRNGIVERFNGSTVRDSEASDTSARAERSGSTDQGRLATVTYSTDPSIMFESAGGAWSRTVPGAAVVESVGCSISVQPFAAASLRALVIGPLM